MNYQGTRAGTLNTVTDSLLLKARGQDGIDGVIWKTGKPGQDGIDGVIWKTGKPGQNGLAGSDATEMSWGSDGTDGGKGGHGGRGTNGTDSGNGGNITVTVANHDRAFLDLIQSHNVSAGIPGQAGQHGRGGPGGRGGYGGNSYSWTTTSTYTTIETTTDFDGDTHVSFVEHEQTEDHSNPGGRNGRNGPEGDMYTYPLYPGKKGTKGQYQIVLIDAGQVLSRHNALYELSLALPHFVPHNASDIFEPGDSVNAIYQVNNTASTMASPPEKVDIRVGLSNGLTPIKVGEVAGDIPAGGRHDNTEQPAQFKLDVPREEKRYEPYRQNIIVCSNAVNTRLNRDYPNSMNTHTLEVKFPVAFKKHEPNYTIASDENETIPAGIDNISNKAIGDTHHRSLSIDLRDDKGNVLHEYPIQSSNGKSSDENFNHLFEFESSAKQGEIKTFERNLYLQVLGSDKKTCIESQKINVQLTPKYQSLQSGFTLVINGETTEALLAHWNQHLNNLSGGKGVAIWNTSYYQNLPLQDQLLPEVGHGSVVVLDNTYRVNGCSQTTSEMLNYEPNSA